jgi:predicted HicB family RNase H-like nuclease
VRNEQVEGSGIADECIAGQEGPGGTVGIHALGTKPLKDFSAVKSIAGKPADELTIDHRSGRVRLSLRLDPKRHMALQNTATHLQKSSQQIITEALDNYLNLALSILNKKSPGKGNKSAGNGDANKNDSEWRTKASQAKRLAAKRLADKKSQAGNANKART